MRAAAFSLLLLAGCATAEYERLRNDLADLRSEYERDHNEWSPERRKRWEDRLDRTERRVDDSEPFIPSDVTNGVLGLLFLYLTGKPLLRRRQQNKP